MRGVPVTAPEAQVLVARFAGEQGGQQNPVVGRRRLRPHDGDVVAAGSGGGELLEEFEAGHAGADDDEAFGLHLAHAASTKRWRS